METSLTKRFLEYIVNYDQAKVNACLKISIYGSGNGFLVRNIYKIHVEFENVTIEYLSVQGGIYSTTQLL
jgi:hypothetical protein